MEKNQHSLRRALLSQDNLSHLDELKINYALELLRNEGIKTLIFIAFFSWFGLLSAFLLCMAFSCTVRIFSGGIHMKTNVGCFLLSAAFYTLELFILPYVPLPEIYYTLGMLLSIAVVCILSPIPSYKRPIKSRQKYYHCKQLTILFSFVWGILLLLVIQNEFLRHCGIWNFIIQAVQMTIQWIDRKGKNTETYNPKKEVI